MLIGHDLQYIAAPKDLVLGTIIARHSEGYRVDLGCSQMASLDALAFEGATKRSKPNLKVSPIGQIDSHSGWIYIMDGL